MARISIYNTATFHSELTISRSPAENHNLRIRLGLCVQKVPGKPSTFKDFGGNSFKIREWNYLEWMNFWDTIFDQCEMWNNQFWLIPPRDYSKLDVKVGDMKFRPNVK